MGDDQNGLVFDDPRDGLVHLPLVFRIDIGRRLVEHDDRSVLQNDPGEGDALTLTAGQSAPGFSGRRVVALGQTENELLALGFPRRLPDLFVRGVGPSYADVLEDALII